MEVRLIEPHISILQISMTSVCSLLCRTLDRHFPKLAITTYTLGVYCVTRTAYSISMTFLLDLILHALFCELSFNLSNNIEPILPATLVTLAVIYFGPRIKRRLHLTLHL